jgi:hypothetical protein
VFAKSRHSQPLSSFKFSSGLTVAMMSVLCQKIE